MKLNTDNASAAIIIDKKNNFLLQKRDKKNNIFFPDHWGFFGGAKNRNETYINALKRELNEEIGFIPSRIEYFMKISFDFNKKKIIRYVYICKVNKLKKEYIKLNEGADFGIFSLAKIKTGFKNKNIYVPYDYLALWFFINKNNIN